MTDIMDSQAVKAAAAASAANAAQPSAHQPLRTAVVKAAELARAAEERARDKQHAKGKKTARERLDLLFDTGTFEEIGRFQGSNIAGGNAGAAVITGFGQVYGRKVAVYAQDFSVKGGTLGTAEGEKICRLMDMAIDLKVPIVAIVDSGGARIQEGVAALTQYGRIFRKTCEASGFVPQLSLILGPCAGGAVYCPALTDLIIMTRENSNMFVTGPDVVKASTGETISMADLGGGEVHNRVSGVAHYLGEDESDAIDYARTVLAYLPSNSESKPPVYAYANAQVPMVTVVLRKAFGGAYIVMGSKAIGADLNFAWPSSQIAVLGAAGAVNIIHRHDLAKAKASGQDVDALRAKYIKEYETSTVNANLSLEIGQIDGMIDPEQTREVIVESLATLATKRRVKRTTKHHGNQPL